MNTSLNKLSKSIRFIIAASATASLATALPVMAQEQGEEDAAVEKIAVIGSRGAPRSIGDSPVPIDIIGGDELVKSGSTDMLNMLSSSVPSLSVTDQPISDAGTMVRPLNLRGLSSDSTLVLLNGKRRHRSSVITLQGGGLNDGAHSPDIAVIPGIALKQVEVLRDGAAAQYGSDAIAGVINFVLKNDNEGGSVEVKYGSTYDGDGDTTTTSANIGLPFTDDGFANFSLQYKNADATVRSNQRADAKAIADAGNTFIKDPAQVWGSPKIEDDITLFANFGLDLGDDKEWYMFGNYSERDVTGGFYFRNPHTRGSVFSNDGGVTLLVGDMDGLGQGIECPTITIADSPTGSVLDHPDFIAIADNSTALGSNCFATNEIHPGGYTPNFGGNVTDTSFAMGVKGEINGGFLNEVRFDLSGTVGRNEATFFLKNSINSSLGMDSPVNFNPGKYIQLEKNFNFDLVKAIEVGMGEPLNVAGGLEWHEESFEVVAGDEASYSAGPLIDQGFNLGSHGFPGFQPSQAGVFSRRNYAAYLDVEAYISENLMFGGALRYEDYQSFGNTTNYKVTFQWSVTDDFSVRGSTSTGFRAPTAGQANLSNVSTALTNGQLIDSALLPPTSEFAKLFGGTELNPEESTNYTLGMVYQAGDFFFTADLFQIKMDDRISQSNREELTESDYLKLEAIGVANPRSVGSVSFFTNDFETTTKGLDLVANYSTQLFDGDSKFALVYNWTKTTVDTFSELTGEFKVMRLEDGLPKHRAVLSFTQSWDDISFFARINYYGSMTLVHADEFAEEVGSEMTFDAEFNYHVMENLRISVGGTNLFDQTTPEPDQSYGAKHYETAPYGFNGGYYYVKATYSF